MLYNLPEFGINLAPWFDTVFENDQPRKRGLFLIAGPCVIESHAHAKYMAMAIKQMAAAAGIPFVFKASFDKANRTSHASYRGPGLARGLDILDDIRRTIHVPVLTDVHEAFEAGPVADVVDIIQIPAFLCRQTDVVQEAARTGKIINVKKGQFLSPWDAKAIVDKARAVGNDRVMLTERGSTFGYNNLVVDFRSLPIMSRFGCPVIFDATHSLQLPGGEGSHSGGTPEFIPHLVRGAVAVGVDGVFMEVHDQPEKALSDGANALKLDRLPAVLAEMKRIHQCLNR
jgi:2-dehydro-3-deoxyphosphooctonate aldolase (KDO 8-P synthase)